MSEKNSLYKAVNYRRAWFQKALTPLFGEMELGVGKDRCLLNSHFGTNFNPVACLVPEL